MQLRRLPRRHRRLHRRCRRTQRLLLHIKRVHRACGAHCFGQEGGVVAAACCGVDDGVAAPQDLPPRPARLGRGT